MKVTVCDLCKKQIEPKTDYFGYGRYDICNDCVNGSELEQIKNNREEWDDKYMDHLDQFRDKYDKILQKKSDKWKETNPEPPTVLEYLRSKYPEF